VAFGVRFVQSCLTAVNIKLGANLRYFSEIASNFGILSVNRDNFQTQPRQNHCAEKFSEQPQANFEQQVYNLGHNNLYISILNYKAVPLPENSIKQKYGKQQLHPSGTNSRRNRREIPPADNRRVSCT
jgi:hypothetical protein